ncbi:MAG: hypothetical protein EPN70_07085 [Paraburkholderia sp.]|uniref:hypothetical protein n=1 Tax=Paraburkholderia sp. TaxID=1926495 RepID=UPI0011F865EF|nr:hypothetical protein [Paraburkholderia sp.]TAM05936.1 MAG: hypothetical protein EPN70_07085 [Paraburkholderia sp.]
MPACITTPAHSRRSARGAAVVCGFLAAGVSAVAAAQQGDNPGDIVVARDITPRSAFANVPKRQDPVAVRATTFPASGFDPAMAAVASDADLTNARGSAGVAPGSTTNTNANAAGMQALTGILSGRNTGSNVAMGASAQPGGIGNTISSGVNGALAPLAAALGVLK